MPCFVKNLCLQKIPFSNMIKRILMFKSGRRMDLVPLKKNNLTRAQFEQLSDVPPEDECIRDLGHIRCQTR